MAKKVQKGSKKDQVFTAEERAAMKEYVREKQGRARGMSADDEARAVRDKIAAMAPKDRALGERLHKIIMAAAPDLQPRLWYGMPAYSKDGKTLCFFQDSAKFKTRYVTLGFSDKAQLDEGAVWATSFAILEISAKDEARIAALVKRAAG